MSRPTSPQPAPMASSATPAADLADDSSARKAFWAQQMDAAYALIEKVAKQKVEECGEPLSALAPAAQSAKVPLEFSSTLLAGKMPRLFYLRQSLIEPVLNVARAMDKKGWILKIEDAFRTPEMQRQLGLMPAVFDSVLQKCLWERNGDPPTFDFFARRATVMVAHHPFHGTHLSGSAIDISVLDAPTRQEISRGGPYLETSEKTPMQTPYISSQDQEHRLEISAILQEQGFIAFPYEFWHYNQHDALAHAILDKKGPAKFGPIHWEESTGALSPVADPFQSLHQGDFLREQFQRALHRYQQPTADPMPSINEECSP